MPKEPTGAYATEPEWTEKQRRRMSADALAALERHHRYGTGELRVPSLAPVRVERQEHVPHAADGDMSVAV